MPDEPTPEEMRRYRVAWGESEVVHLTDWRYWEQMYDDALEVIRQQAVSISALNAEIERLRKELGDA